MGEGRGEGSSKNKRDRIGQHREKGGWERTERNNGWGGRERVKSSKQARKRLTTMASCKNRTQSSHVGIESESYGLGAARVGDWVLGSTCLQAEARGRTSGAHLYQRAFFL